MSDNWVVQNLQNALSVWDGKLTEIWQLLTMSPESFKGGTIWTIARNIHGTLQAIGYALLILFFVTGMVKTCGSFADMKRPEQALKVFVRFAIAKGVITHGLELMMALMSIAQGVVLKIMTAAGFSSPSPTTVPNEIVSAVEDCGFFEAIPLWAVTLIGGLFVWVLAFTMILMVYASPCAITQNVEYLLDSVQASTMLSNSEFIVMLNQAESDQERLAKLLNISPEQMRYVNNAATGSGLLRYGNALIPFVNRFPRSTELYKLITTKPGESIFTDDDY